MSGARETSREPRTSVASLLAAFAPQQPQGVVLLRRQIVALEQLFLDHVQAIVGAPQVQKRFLFERVEPVRVAIGCGMFMRPCYLNGRDVVQTP